MFIVNPNQFLLPSFGMTPFTSDYVTTNHLLKEDDYAVRYLNKKFEKSTWAFTYNGREAIALALKYYDFQKDDLVTIVTTSENFYISSCVTLEIESVCRWNREIVPETKLIFVNHEFGYPYPHMDKLKSTGLPIIEDCCTTFFSQNESEQIGKYGDFTVYSLPKFFPVQIGGILVSNNYTTNQTSKLSESETRYIINALSHNLKEEQDLLSKRRDNFNYGLRLFSKMGFEERFSLENKIVPYAMLLRNKNVIKELNNFKIHLTNNGIQSSLFYGEDGFFVPIHQSLSFYDIEFIAEVISHYLKHNNQ